MLATNLPPAGLERVRVTLFMHAPGESAQSCPCQMQETLGTGAQGDSSHLWTVHVPKPVNAPSPNSGHLPRPSRRSKWCLTGSPRDVGPGRASAGGRLAEERSSTTPRICPSQTGRSAAVVLMAPVAQQSRNTYQLRLKPRVENVQWGCTGSFKRQMY